MHFRFDLETVEHWSTTEEEHWRHCEIASSPTFWEKTKTLQRFVRRRITDCNSFRNISWLYKLVHRVLFHSYSQTIWTVKSPLTIIIVGYLTLGIEVSHCLDIVWLIESFGRECDFSLKTRTFWSWVLHRRSNILSSDFRERTSCKTLSRKRFGIQTVEVTIEWVILTVLEDLNFFPIRIQK